MGDFAAGRAAYSPEGCLRAAPDAGSLLPPDLFCIPFQLFPSVWGVGGAGLGPLTGRSREAGAARCGAGCLSWIRFSVSEWPEDGASARLLLPAREPQRLECPCKASSADLKMGFRLMLSSTLLIALGISQPVIVLKAGI